MGWWRIFALLGLNELWSQIFADRKLEFRIRNGKLQTQFDKACVDAVYILENTSANGWLTTTWSLYFREMIKNTILIYILIYGRNVCWMWWEYMYLMLITHSSVSYVDIFRNGDNILTFQVPVPFISTYGTLTWSQAWWRHPMETFSALLTLCNRWIPITTASDAELWCPYWSAPEQTVVQTIETPVIWDVIALIVTSL